MQNLKKNIHKIKSLCFENAGTGVNSVNTIIVNSIIIFKFKFDALFSANQISLFIFKDYFCLDSKFSKISSVVLVAQGRHASGYDAAFISLTLIGSWFLRDAVIR